MCQTPGASAAWQVSRESAQILKKSGRMRSIEWTERMSVGVPLLDADHKIFIDIINDGPILVRRSRTARPLQWGIIAPPFSRRRPARPRRRSERPSLHRSAHREAKGPVGHLKGSCDSPSRPRFPRLPSVARASAASPQSPAPEAPITDVTACGRRIAA